MEITSYAEGEFCWAELGSSHPRGAVQFYSQLFPWEVQESHFGEDQIYTIFRYENKDIVAMYDLGNTTDSSYWGCYISVDNIEVSSKRAQQLGAEILIAPKCVNDKGSMCAFRDPTGAIVALWEAGEHPGAGTVHTPYSMDWHELYTTDSRVAAEFYMGLLGWSKEVIPTSTGSYLQFRAKGHYAAGIKQISPEMKGMVSNWGIYFKVSDCNETLRKATKLGAKIVVPLTEIAGSGSFVVIQDPYGAYFSVQTGF